MAVAFDTVGPGSTGTAASTTSPLSWTHTTGAGANAILVAVCQDSQNNNSTTATCNGTTMTSLGLIAKDGTTTDPPTGFIEYMKLFLATASVTASAGNAIVVSTAQSVQDMEAGSLSFSGYTGNGTVVSQAALKTVIIPSNTSGNIIAGFFSAGNTITQAGAPATGQFLDNAEGNSPRSLGNIAGVTAPATGSSVTITWVTSATTFCSIGVEMQGASGTDTSAAYATSASDLGGGSGSWSNVTNAEALDAAYAVWTS